MKTIKVQEMMYSIPWSTLSF